MDDLVQWLRAQLDEDERITRAASWTDDANVWHAEPSPFDTRGAGQRWYVEDAMEDGVVSHVDPRASDDEGVARHIAEWDPARVLREIDAKRQMLKQFVPELAQTDATIAGEWNSHDDLEDKLLAYLALPYADRPGYRDEWRP